MALSEDPSKASLPAPGHSFSSLVSVMQKLLDPGGCPWDQEQTLASLRPYLIEECAEVLDAIEMGQPSDHCEELGDLLMQIVFHAQIRQAEGAFSIDDVIAGIREKLIRRHPHVFSDGSAADADEVLVQWEAIKLEEKKARGQISTRALDGVPVALSPLARAQALSKKAAKVGFDWPDIAGCRAKIDEELSELDVAMAANDHDSIAEELGDLMFATVSLARKLKCNADMSLRDTITKFVRRFEYIESSLESQGQRVEDAEASELDRLWNEAKITPKNPQ